MYETKKNPMPQEQRHDMSKTFMTEASRDIKKSIRKNPSAGNEIVEKTVRPIYDLVMEGKGEITVEDLTVVKDNAKTISKGFGR